MHPLCLTCSYLSNTASMSITTDNDIKFSLFLPSDLLTLVYLLYTQYRKYMDVVSGMTNNLQLFLLCPDVRMAVGAAVAVPHSIRGSF